MMRTPFRALPSPEAFLRLDLSRQRERFISEVTT